METVVSVTGCVLQRAKAHAQVQPTLISSLALTHQPFQHGYHLGAEHTGTVQ